jgi:GNAT superfamily N-acetyltransferase
VSENIYVSRYHEAFRPQIFGIIEGMNKEILDDCNMSIQHSMIHPWINATWNTGFVLVAGMKPVGAIGAFETTNTATGDRVLQQVFWYVYPEYRKHGIKLLEALEAQAKHMGAKAVIMSLMMHKTSAHMGRFYKMRGYKKIEEQYMKEVSQ